MFCVFVTISLYIYSITSLILSFIQSKTNSSAKMSSKIVVFKIFKFKISAFFNRITRFERVTKFFFRDLLFTTTFNISRSRSRNVFATIFRISFKIFFKNFRFRLFKRVFFVNDEINEKYDNDDENMKKKFSIEEISQMRYLRRKIVQNKIEIVLRAEFKKIELALNNVNMNNNIFFYIFFFTSLMINILLIRWTSYLFSKTIKLSSIARNFNTMFYTNYILAFRCRIFETFIAISSKWKLSENLIWIDRSMLIKTSSPSIQ